MDKILVVEDDKTVYSGIKKLLELQHYSVVIAQNGMEALEKIDESFSLVIMDIMMPKMDGYTACREIKKIKDIPFIMLSARGEEYDKLIGFDLGIDDYVTKPFGSEELVARVRSALRTVLYQAHDSELPTGKFQTGDLLIDYEARRVFIGDEEIKLTQTEYNIVDLLSRHPGKMLTYSFIVKEVWGYNDMGSTKRLQVNMANIRKKFGVKPGKKSFIINELGVGYRMCDDE